MKPKNWFQTEKLTWNRKIDLKPRNWFKTRKLIWKRKIDLKTKNWFEIEKHKNLYWCYRKTKFEMQRVWKSILLSGTTLSKKKKIMVSCINIMKIANFQLYEHVKCHMACHIIYQADISVCIDVLYGVSHKCKCMITWQFPLPNQRNTWKIKKTIYRLTHMQKHGVR